eukprot:TRINITY_DN36318_c0_g1_i1.p1 TRINITY_DN36318_c0_g1~~TRINITY_DN36318_c0_g1_i1.p1  ORF type:complete len:196 (-),score=20.38 TRINITY_DN36318_c0_g1_i1:181-768(-)
MRRRCERVRLSACMFARSVCFSASATTELLRALFDAGRIEEVATLSWVKYLPDMYWRFLELICVFQGTQVYSASRASGYLLSYRDGRFELNGRLATRPLVGFSCEAKNYSVSLYAFGASSLAGSIKEEDKTKGGGSLSTSQDVFWPDWQKTNNNRAKRRSRRSQGAKRPAVGDRLTDTEWDWEGDGDNDWEEEEG